MAADALRFADQSMTLLDASPAIRPCLPAERRRAAEERRHPDEGDPVMLFLDLASLRHLARRSHGSAGRTPVNRSQRFAAPLRNHKVRR